MKNMSPVRFAGHVLLLACAMAGVSAPGTKPARPASPAELVGDWFGFDSDMLVFCRLELRQQGGGLYSITYVDEPALLYVIEEWSLNGFSLTMKTMLQDS